MALRMYLGCVFVPIDRLRTCLSRLPDVIIVHIVPFCSDLKTCYL